MISATRWVPRGAPAEVPRRADLDEAEMSRIAELAKLELAEAEEDLAEARDPQAHPPVNASRSIDDDDDLKEYNMSDYDDEVAKDHENTIAGVQNLAYYGPDEEDEYMTLPAAQDAEEEIEEMRVLNTDNMLLAAKTEDDVSLLEVHVYDDKEGSLYVHHDFMLPSFPLCLEWVPIVPGTKSERGNFVAIGTFDPEIELWDLDVVDGAFPTAILGKTDRPEAKALGTGKKKRKLKRANDAYHVDAILSLSSNPIHANVLASGSADQTIKLWDLESTSTEAATRSLSGYHRSKVSSVAWNPTDGSVLLSGGYDGHARVGDMRAENVTDASRSFKVSGDVENVQWDNDGVFFYVGTDGGILYKFDARADNKPVWSLQAHDAEITSFNVNTEVPDMLVTASSDRLVKLWNLSGDKPSMILSRDLDVGKVFSVGFGPEKATSGLLAVAGSEGTLKVWDSFTNKAVRGAFGKTSTRSGEHLVVANDDDSEEESDAGVEGDEFDEDEE